MDHTLNTVGDQKNTKDLVGLVLIGGRSSRMGTDKAFLELDGISLASVAHSKLKCYCEDVYFSINESQLIYGLENTILDEYKEEGPLSGIISALRAMQRSILVLGVDLPLISKQRIKRLIEQRNKTSLSTSYKNANSKSWEPMLSIWEIHALPILENYFNGGERSIQKFLNNYSNQSLAIQDLREFTNLNTTEDFLSVTKGSKYLG